MLVTVTQEMIDIAQANFENPNRGTECPLALAISEARGIKTRVLTTCYLDDGSLGDKYQLPQIAKDFRSAFDAGLTVGPIQFEIEN